MTREEEIIKEANEYCNGNRGSDARVRTAFLMGANYADEHPSQELKQKFIDEACNWMLETFYDDFSGIPVTTYGMQSMINDFRAKMEEEL